MKKFYTTLALAVAVAFSASAGQHKSTAVTPLNKVNANVETVATPFASQLVKNTVKAPAKAPAIDKIANEYTWAYYGLLTNDLGDQTSTATISIADAATGKLTIILEDFEVPATYDASTGKVTIANKQYVGKDADGDLYFYLKELDDDGKPVDGAAAAASTFGIYDEAENLIMFEPAYVWALGDPANENAGWYFLRALNEFEISNWVLLGTGTYNEPVSQGFLETPLKPYAVEVYKNENQLKIVDPLKGFYAANKWDGTSPDLIVDVTDPDNAVISLTAAGFGNGKGGTWFYCSTSFNQKDPADTPASQRISYKETDTEAKLVFTQKSMLLYLNAEEPGLFYLAEDASNLPYLTVTLSDKDGIDDITIDNSNAPVEYFNLQGIRIAEPTTGVVIRRQGNSVSKILVK